MTSIRVATPLALALLLAACTSPSESRSTESPRATAPGPTGDTGVEEPTASTGDTGVEKPTAPTGDTGVEEPDPVTSVTLEAPRKASFLVDGLYPRFESRCVGYTRGRLAARYPGTLIVERADDGTLTLSASIPFEEYLKGIAEVPPSWPMAALQAQAIAARSYALASTGWTGEGETLDEPICSTSSCQVYRGIPLDPSSDQHRWYRAVRETRGEILVHQGRPATTFYSSTSNGQTYGNEDVFGGDPLPYLRPVVEEHDGASGLSHWSSRIRFEDLAVFLEAAGEWDGSTIGAVDVDGETVTVTGPGRSATIDESTFRGAINDWDSCLVPSRYPPGGLPTTIPSHWVTYGARGDSLIATGRGWGHGVGMVQWGAYGRARLGWSASEILSFYYGGFEPEPFPEPGIIEVQIADGLELLRLEPSAFGATVNGEPLERGLVQIRGGEELTVVERGAAPVS